jgi:predicted NBD/HSP70 family sugar kinase
LTHERSASGSALAARFGLRAEDLRSRCEAQDPRALEAYEFLIARAGRLLANLATLVDPDLIVVGGGLSKLGPWFLDPLAERIRLEAYSLASQTPLVPAYWSEDAGIRGLLGLLPPQRPAGPTT